MKDEAGILTELTAVSPGYWLMKIKVETIARQARPGQFVMVRVSPTRDPLLRRPFGILNASGPFIWLYFQVVGPGSAALAQRRVGESIPILGPLGNGFPAFSGRRMLLVAGGRGIVPLFFAAETGRAANRVQLLYGGKNARDLNLLDRLSPGALHGHWLLSEDGSAGERGLVTDRLQAVIREQAIDLVLACGPDAMFAAIARQSAGGAPETWVSLEAYMGCGMGVCLSCVVKTSGGDYTRVCADGPVYRLEEIAWPI
jgi:dihydroorotate dehydrogenase electron transfer subunit